MAEQTPDQIYWQRRLRNYKIATFVTLAALAIFAFLSMRACNKQEAANLAYKTIRDTLLSVLADNSRINAISRGLKQENADLDLHIANLISDRDQTKEELIYESDRANRLANEVKKAKINKDTAKLMDSCIELAGQVKQLTAKIASQEAGVEKIIEAANKRIRISDSLANHWENAYDSCFSAVKAAVVELPKIKPRGQWYLTGSGFISGPVFGGAAGIQHITKKGLLISCKPMLTNYGKGAMVDFGLPLNFKRR